MKTFATTDSGLNSNRNFILDKAHSLKIQSFMMILVIATSSISFLGLINVFLLHFYSDANHLQGIMFQYNRLFNLNLEANIPSWFSSFLMLISAFYLWIIYNSKNRESLYKKHWLYLSLIFLFLSLDEISSIHEIMNNPTRRLLHSSGIFYWSWLIPALFLLSFGAIYFIKFLYTLPKRTRNLFLFSAVVFITGAVGFEMIGGWLYSHNLAETMLYNIEVWIEESLELIGLLIFIYSLRDYLFTHCEIFSIKL
jgi:hypothetical protein